MRYFDEHVFPQGTRRRQNFDLVLKGGNSILNCGWREFLIQLVRFLSSKGFRVNPMRFSIVAPIYKDSSTELELLNDPWLNKTIFLEIVILDYKDDLRISDKFKLIKRDDNLSFSEALNDATLACSGESVLFFSKDSSLDKRKLLNYLSKSVKHNNWGIFIQDPSKVSARREGPAFLSSDIFLAKRDWIVGFGGFDDQFISEPYVNNDLNFSARNLLYKFDVLTEAARIFNANPDTLKCLKKSKNSVYECEIENEKRILRILERPSANVDLVECEIDWIDYLTDRGVPAPIALPSINGKKVEIITRPNTSFIISCFTKVSGHNIDTRNDWDWNDDLFQKWGQIMGLLHCLTKNYKSGRFIKRNDWNTGRFFQGELDFLPKESKVLKLWWDLLDELSSLPKDDENYGLVHNDMHYNNILASGSQITVIDFDGCAYNWFACDIAIALYEALWTVPYSERNEFAVRIIRNFFLGYNKENHLDQYWIYLIPKFLKFREIYTYLIFMKDWNHNILTLSQKNVLSVRKKHIEMEIPCIEIDLDNITR